MLTWLCLILWRLNYEWQTIFSNPTWLLITQRKMLEVMGIKVVTFLPLSYFEKKFYMQQRQALCWDVMQQWLSVIWSLVNFENCILVLQKNHGLHLLILAALPAQSAYILATFQVSPSHSYGLWCKYLQSCKVLRNTKGLCVYVCKLETNK